MGGGESLMGIGPKRVERDAALTFDQLEPGMLVRHVTDKGFGRDPGLLVTSDELWWILAVGKRYSLHEPGRKFDLREKELGMHHMAGRSDIISDAAYMIVLAQMSEVVAMPTHVDLARTGVIAYSDGNWAQGGYIEQVHLPLLEST